ncbi:MAG: hypothetical protein ACRDGI_11345 [Candidatus Limnocylindrales bacterium]
MSDADITYEDVKKAADQNGVTVDQVLETIGRSADKDRLRHAAEYSKAAAT